MNDKELTREIAEALGWTDLHWEDGYSRPNGFGWVTKPSGWCGKGPEDANFVHIDSILLDAWHTRRFEIIRTILKIAERAKPELVETDV